MKYINHSGGCPGADMAWDIVGQEYDVESVHYSFYNHVTPAKNPHLLSHEQLNEGFEHVVQAAKSLKRPVYQLMPYVKNLLSRNWYQVKHSEAIFPIGKFLDTTKKFVDGGTGWAVQMAVDNNKPIYFYDQELCHWFTYNYETNQFEKMTEVPTLTQNFAGIGTRAINDDGIQAIGEAYANTFNRRF